MLQQCGMGCLCDYAELDLSADFSSIIVSDRRFAPRYSLLDEAFRFGYSRSETGECRCASFRVLATLMFSSLEAV